MKKPISLMLSMALLATTIVTGNAQKNVDAKIITVGNVASYLALDFYGNTSKPTKIYLDNEAKEFTPVTDDGMIIKREFDGAHKTLKVDFADGTHMEKEIASIYKRFPYKTNLSNPKCPDAVVGHATMAVWDFHKIAKGKNGNELTYPESTTFNLGKNPKKTVVDTVTTPTPGDHAATARDVVITYDLTKRDEKRKYNKIQRGYKVVNGKKTAILSHNKLKDGTVGKLIFPSKLNPSLTANGGYKIAVKYRGVSAEDLRDVPKDPLTPSKPDGPKFNDPNPKEVLTAADFDIYKDIVFNYNLNDPAQKRIFDRISKMVKRYNNEQELALNFRKTTEGNVGKLTIFYGSSRPIQHLGKHVIKLYHDKEALDTKTIVYRGKAPQIRLTADSGEYLANYTNIFILRGFEYTFQHETGIKAVYVNGTELVRKRVINGDENYDELIKKGEKVAKNEEENPWHVVGNVFRIKNEGVKVLKKGLNYLTIKYDNYHDSRFVFVLNEAPKLNQNGAEDKNPVNDKESSASSDELKPGGVIPLDKLKTANAVNSSMAGAPSSGMIVTHKVANALNLDTISSASVGGGGTSKPTVGGDSDGGGTVNMGAKLVFNFDMIANAVIIEKLGYENEGVKKFIDSWEGTSKEFAMFKSNLNRKVIWDSYVNHVQSNRINNGVYESFLAYYKDPNVETTKNSNAQVKYVLIGGIGLPIYDMNEIFEVNSGGSDSDLKSYPNDVEKTLDTLVRGADVKFPASLWTEAITSITVDGRKLEENVDYEKDHSNNVLVLKGKIFAKEGNVTIVINADGYKTLTKEALVKVPAEDSVNIRFKEEAYEGNLPTHNSDEIKFEITDKHMGLMDNKSEITGIEIKKKDEAEFRELMKDKDYSYYRFSGMVNIKPHVAESAGTYVIKFKLTGHSDVIMEVQVR